MNPDEKNVTRLVRGLIVDEREDEKEVVEVRDGRPAPPRPAPPCPAKKGLPRPANKQVLPRPAKIGKTCGAGRGKVYLNPLKIRPLSVPIRFVRH